MYQVLKATFLHEDFASPFLVVRLLPNQSAPGWQGKRQCGRMLTFLLSPSVVSFKFSSECFKETLNLEKAGGVTLLQRTLRTLLKSKLHLSKNQIKVMIVGKYLCHVFSIISC